MRMPETEVTMIGHASALIRCQGTALLTDPWYFGAIFNDSWELLSEPYLAALDRVTHIWISHEHPDHLHFPTLKMLRDRLGGHSTILFQRHRSREVVKALDAIGFERVVELPPATWVNIAEGFEILCLPSRRIDSMLAVRTPSATILNVNDCKLGRNYTGQVARIVGRPDLLLAQFSIANRPGNKGAPPNPQKRYRVADRARGYTTAFRPRQLLLFASFARFCHVENDYINDWALPPSEAEQYLKSSCDCAVGLLYPGDRWYSDARSIAAEGAGALYAKDWQAAANRPLKTSASVAMREIVEAGRNLNAKLAERFPALVRCFARPVLFYVDDHQQAVCFDVAKANTSVVGHSRGDCHFALNSQALWYAFTHRWGIDTLDVSGRYELIRGPKAPAAFRLCDEYSAGLDLRAIGTLLKTGLSPRRWWSKRGELMDVIEDRIQEWGRFR